MSGHLLRIWFAILLLVASGAIAEGQAPPPPPTPTVDFQNGPKGVGSPPEAGKVQFDVKWSDCTGANTLVHTVWEYPGGNQAPVNKGTTSAGIAGTTGGTITEQRYINLTTGRTVVIVAEVRDASGTVIARKESAGFVVP